MLHLDEGVLHAYLDGAESRNELREKNIERHLATCAECREALERARRVRDRAHEILGDAAPKSVTPMPLSELQRWAEARPAEPAPRRRVNTKALALAATVVLAVAAGWMTRGVLTSSGVGDQVGSSPQTLARADTVMAAAPAEPEPQPASPAAAEPAAEDQPSLAAVEAETSAVQTAEPIVTAEAPSAGDTTPPVLVDELRIAPPPVAARQAAPQAARQEAVRFGGVGAWTTVNQGVAEVHLGSPIVTIPDLPVVTIGIGGAGPGPSVRVIQQLDTARTIELIMIRAQEADAAGVASAVEREAAAPAQDVRARAADTAVNTTSIRRDGLLITARGMLQVDSLRTLVERAR